MIEEIKKLCDENQLENIKCDCNCLRNFVGNLEEILDKYDNQPDYKGAWEELKTNEMAVDKISLDIMQELEQKYKLDILNKGIDELIKKYEDELENIHRQWGDDVFHYHTYEKDLYKEIIQDLKKLKGDGNN